MRRGISQQRYTLWCCLASLFGLVACTGAPAPGTSPATPASPTAYPDLASVPDRPKLGYTVEQRRTVTDELIADRANAHYRAAMLAYESGRSRVPPPPPPAAPSPAPAPASAASTEPPAAPAEPPGDGKIARAYVESNLHAADDEGELRDFMRRMDRPIPDPYGPRTVTQAVGLAPREDAAEEGSLDGFGSFLGGVLGLEATGQDAPSDASQR